MSVQGFLKVKGNRVVTTYPEATIQMVAHRMITEGIGAIVVVDPADDRIAGIISERDIARALSKHGAELLKMRVADVMTTSVGSCTPRASIKHVMTVMAHSRIRHLPVVDDRRLCGIISIGDIVKHQLHEMEIEVNAVKRR